MRPSLILAPLIVSTAIASEVEELKSSTLEAATNKDSEKPQDDVKDLTGWSQNVYNTFYLLANWAKVSYCTVLNPGFTEGLLSESCPDMEFCHDFEDAKIVEIFKPSLKEKKVSGTSYVAADKINKKVYLVFRGSISVGDWTTDLLFKQCNYAPILKNENINAETFAHIDSETDEEAINFLIDENAIEKPCKGCKVHCGIYVAFAKFIEEIEEVIKPFTDKGYQLVITGHSLGGGYAYLAGLDFLLAGYKPLVVSFASLRVGNPAWNVFLDEQFNTELNEKIIAKGGDLPIPSFSRVYQKTDIVPRLPPHLPGFPDYTHSGLDFRVDKITLPQTKEVVEFRGKSDNYENEPFEFELYDMRAITELYQHIHLLIRIYFPCNDWSFPFVR
jgi:hypothetical protein